MKHSIKLGKVYKDSITGYTGMALSITYYLHGCESVGLQRTKVEDDGTVKKWEWFDVARLVHVPGGNKDGGGPCPFAPEKN